MSALIVMGHFLPFTVAALSLTARIISVIDSVLHQVALVHRTLHLTFIVQWSAPKAAEAKHSSKRKVISMNADENSAEIEAMARRLAEISLPLTVQEDVGFVSNSMVTGALDQMRTQSRGDVNGHGPSFAIAKNLDSQAAKHCDANSIGSSKTSNLGKAKMPLTSSTSSLVNSSSDDDDVDDDFLFNKQHIHS
jgi:hypothetical protein